MMAMLALAACALAGCGQSTSQQVQAKVQQFATAVKAHDASTLCDQVLAPALLARFTDIGLPCTKAMKTFFSSVHDPSLAVGRVAVQDGGREAEAITLSTAKGQVGALTAIELVKTSGGWRVSQLGSPLLPGQEKKAKK
jgi:ketosteroid isomerase-like protein